MMAATARVGAISICHCERSEAIQGNKRELDCFGATRLAMTSYLAVTTTGVPTDTR
jgi:hypothetical protein